MKTWAPIYSIKSYHVIREITGTNSSVANRKFAIVVSQYNRDITQKLLDGSLQCLRQANVPDDNVTVFWVPGAWEIPFAAQHVLKFQNPDAVIGLGCVIKGETTHDQHINTTVASSLGQLGLEFGVPVAFGLLTVNTYDQAVQRAGGKVGNKGIESAAAVIQLLQLYDAVGQ